MAGNNSCARQSSQFPECSLTTRKSQTKHRSVQDAASEVGSRLEEEMHEFVRWFNRDVVPKARSGSGKALRVASKKLSELADYLDEHRRK